MQTAAGHTANLPDKMTPSGICAVILAAGRSTRFSQDNKLLATFRGQPVLCSVLDAVAESNVARTVLVTTTSIARLTKLTARERLEIALVNDPDNGLAASIHNGLDLVPNSCNGAMIVLADMPLISTKLINSLISIFEEQNGTKIVFPRNSVGLNGHPVLWPRSFFSRLMLLRGDRGAKAILDEHKQFSVPMLVETDEAFFDIDTRDDYERLIQM